MWRKCGCPTDLSWPLNCLGAGGEGGTDEKELSGAEDKEVAEEKDGTLCVLEEHTESET